MKESEIIYQIKKGYKLGFMLTCSVSEQCGFDFPIDSYFLAQKWLNDQYNKALSHEN